MKKTLIVVGIIVLLVVVGVVLSNREVSAPANEELAQTTNEQSPNANVPVGISPDVVAPVTATITFTDAGYAPKLLTVKKGTVVTYKNESTKNTWPASAMHPTHTVYDGTSLKEHCAAPTNTTFDACRGLKPGESWPVTLDKIGTWGYHDHLSPSFFGQIVVTE